MRCHLSNRKVCFILIQSIAAAAAVAVALCVAVMLKQQCCCASSCCWSFRVSDDQICCWFNDSNLGVFFLSIQTRFIFNVPLGSTTVSFLQPRFPTSSVVTCTRASAAGVSPPHRSPFVLIIRAPFEHKRNVSAGEGRLDTIVELLPQSFSVPRVPCAHFFFAGSG